MFLTKLLVMVGNKGKNPYFITEYYIKKKGNG